MANNEDTITINGEKYVKQSVVIDGVTTVKQTGPSKEEIDKAEKLVKKSTQACLAFALLASLVLSDSIFEFLFIAGATFVLSMYVSRFCYLTKHLSKEVLDIVSPITHTKPSHGSIDSSCPSGSINVDDGWGWRHNPLYDWRAGSFYKHDDE